MHRRCSLGLRHLAQRQVGALPVPPEAAADLVRPRRSEVTAILSEEYNRNLREFVQVRYAGVAGPRGQGSRLLKPLNTKRDFFSLGLREC